MLISKFCRNVGSRSINARPSLAAAALLTALYSGSGQGAQIEVLDRGRIAPPPDTAVDVGLQLNVFILEGSGWAVSDVVTMTDRLAGILSQCRVGLDAVSWYVIGVEPSLLDFHGQRSRRLARKLPVAAPVAYLVRDTRDRPAYDAVAFGRANSATRPEFRDTVWVTRAIAHPAVGLSHEIAHVLMNSGAHSTRPYNLMQAESAPANTRLTPSQCGRLRSNGLAYGLLDRRSD